MIEVNIIKSTTIRVESYQVLDQLIDNFPCFTREGVSEVIIEVDLLSGNQQKQLSKLVGATKENPLPDEGYAHFWK